MNITPKDIIAQIEETTELINQLENNKTDNHLLGENHEEIFTGIHELNGTLSRAKDRLIELEEKSEESSGMDYFINRFLDDKTREFSDRFFDSEANIDLDDESVSELCDKFGDIIDDIYAIIENYNEIILRGKMYN